MRHVPLSTSADLGACVRRDGRGRRKGAGSLVVTPEMSEEETLERETRADPSGPSRGWWQFYDDGSRVTATNAARFSIFSSWTSSE
jgi:hypothetical protein